MFKKIQTKLVMLLITMTVSGGILTNFLPLFHNVHTIRKSQSLNIKENHIEDIPSDSQNVQREDSLKNSNLQDVEKKENDSSQKHNDDINKQQSTYSKLETSNHTINTQQSVNSQSHESNSIHDIDTQIDHSQLQEPNNINDTNTPEVASSPLEDTKSNVNTANLNDENAILEVEIPTIHYDRTTSIYANDNITLLRVEYYINNKLTYYSVIEQFDAVTKSYTEKIYQCNRETNIDPLIRTDIYTNGNLVKSY